MAPFTNSRVSLLFSDAQKALEQGEQYFVASVDWGHGVFGSMNAEPSGWVPEIGAMINACEEAGWTYVETQAIGTDSMRRLLLIFRRGMR